MLPLFELLFSYTAKNTVGFYTTVNKIGDSFFVTVVFFFKNIILKKKKLI